MHVKGSLKIKKYEHWVDAFGFGNDEVIGEGGFGGKQHLPQPALSA